LDFKVQTIENLFFYIVACSYLLIPIGLILSKSKNRDTIAISIAVYGIVFSAILLSYYSLPSDKEFRKVVQLLYTFLEYSFFAFIFWSNIKSKGFRKLMVLFSFLFLIFQVIYFFESKLTRLDSIPIGIETILILVYITYFFFESFKNTTTNNYLYNHYCFWISVGILIYLGGSFFFYILVDELSKEQEETFGKMTFVAEIIKNILFGTAVYIYTRYPNKETNKKNQSIPYLDMI